MYRFCHRPASKEPPYKTLLLLFIIFVTTKVVWYYMDSIYWAMVSLVLLFFSVASYFLKTDYLLDENGLSLKTVLEKRREWSEFKRVTMVKNGIFLSTSGKSSVLDSFRGEFVPLDEKKEEIFEFIQRCIKKENQV